MPPRQFLNCLLTALFVLGAVASIAGSETPKSSSKKKDPSRSEAPKPVESFDDTPAGRMKRWKLAEDPGTDPDPKKVFQRDGRPMSIEKYEKKDAAYDVGHDGWVRPRADVNIAAEIYREDDKYLWVWLAAAAPLPELPPLNPDANLAHRPRVSEKIRKEYELLRTEFVPVDPPKTAAILQFEPSSEGLPQEGSWRNALEVGDLDGDGLLDIVTSSQRGSVSGEPYIFLGDGKGGWKFWDRVQWPRGVNYGSVSVGDFDKNGHLDLAFAEHLTGLTVFLNQGEGKFVEGSRGLPQDFPSRRLRVADIDRDGDLDVIAISEGPVVDKPMDSAGTEQIRVYLNDGSGKNWTMHSVAEPGRVIGGDWLAVADFNGDGHADIAGASIYFSGNDTIYLSSGRAKWKPFARGFVPFHSYYLALTAGRFTSKKQDDLIVSYSRFWPDVLDPEQIARPEHPAVAGVDWISWVGGKPKRTAIGRWASDRGISAMANGDFNLDGKLDIVYWRSDKRTLVFLLGDGAGGFSEAEAKGVEIPQNTTYDITVADVNRDQKPDVLLMFESDEKSTGKNGSIRVFVNREEFSKNSGSGRGR